MPRPLVSRPSDLIPTTANRAHSVGMPPRLKTAVAAAVKNHSSAVAIFARAPNPGKAKTRLIPLLGREGAAQFQAALIADAVHKVSSVTFAPGKVTPYLFLSDFAVDAPSAGDPRSVTLEPQVSSARPPRVPGYAIRRQRGADLGTRLKHAFGILLPLHKAAVVIGTDSPLLPPCVLGAALQELRWCDAVLGPCPDGGYYLIGFRRATLPVLSRRPHPAAVASSRTGHQRGTKSSPRAGLFDHVRWGGAFAFRDPLRNLLSAGLSCSILESYSDVDRPEDVRRLRRQLARNPAMRRLAPATWSFITQRRRKNR